ncbi:GerW family sporulation protein [Paenibacillus sp. NPDC056579]|uniref:GerW family sporulation protein n=2 Tax=unclassified Paenibacillus TaxID=185978 RepID=UPI00369C6C2A
MPSEHPLHSFVQTAMQQLKETVSVNTAVGDPVVAPDGSIIIPVCKVSYGFVAGGSELGMYSREHLEAGKPFGGGTGGGVSVTPLAFLIIGKNGVQTVSLEQGNSLYGKMLDLAPQLLDKLQAILLQYTEKPGAASDT